LLFAAALCLIMVGCQAVPPANTPSPAPTTDPLAPGHTADPSTEPVPGDPDAEPPPSSFDKINAALGRGEIDDEQALVYKLYAAFADPRLPEQYRGDDEELHADSVIVEAVERVDEISPETQQLVEPFLMWPGDEGSWLRRRIASRTVIASVGGLNAVAPPQQETALVKVDASRHVLFWHREDRPQDAETARFLAGVVDREIWPKLTGLMGQPLSDHGLEGAYGEDGRVDIVLAGEPIRPYAQPIQG
jgi:hypothetical protein